MKDKSEGTLKPPLVLFKRYGGNATHSINRGPQPVLTTDTTVNENPRRGKGNYEPVEIGRGEESGRMRKAAKEQELRWLELSRMSK